MPYKDKANQAAAALRHYEKNKPAMIARALVKNKQTRTLVREFLDAYLLTHPCVDCGESDIIVLEFDHIGDDKTANISDLWNQGYSLKTVQNEIAKCEVRCANCHRRMTHKRRLG